MKIRAVIQARMGSTRLPGKVLRLLGDHTMLEWVFVRAAGIKHLDGMPIVATTTLPEDDEIARITHDWGFDCYRGDSKDVLRRFVDAAAAYELDAVLRVTADCPLLSPELNSLLVANFREQPCDYLGPADTWPNGLLQEVISTSALRTSARLARSSSDREHVMTHIVRSRSMFDVKLIQLTDLSVDTQEHLDGIQAAFA